MPSGVRSPAAAAYDEWHARASGSGTGPLASWHDNALALAPDVRGERVLEIGCGTGDFSLHLARAGARVTGVDLSSRAVRLAQGKACRHDRRVSFGVADATMLPFADNSFDLVFSCECLEHVPEPRRLIAEAFRVLAPGGLLILTTENYSNGMVLAWIHAWWMDRPFNSGAIIQPLEQFFVFWQVRRWMRAAGFTVERLVGSHHVFLLLPRCHPHTFVKERFASPLATRLFRPVARHMAYRMRKPLSSGPR